MELSLNDCAILALAIAIVVGLMFCVLEVYARNRAKRDAFVSHSQLRSNVTPGCFHVPRSMRDHK